MAVPAGPGADLVLVEADLALGGLEAGLDGPARAGDADQVGERRAVGGVGEIEGELVGLRDAAADQQALFPTGRRVGAIGQIGPVVEPRAFGAIAGTETMPVAGRDLAVVSGSSRTFPRLPFGGSSEPWPGDDRHPARDADPDRDAAGRLPPWCG